MYLFARTSPLSPGTKKDRKRKGSRTVMGNVKMMGLLRRGAHLETRDPFIGTKVGV